MLKTGVQFTNYYGDINEAYYNSLASTFKGALKLMQKHDILEMFSDRIFSLVKNTSDIGWGFNYQMLDTWAEYYPELDEDENYSIDPDHTLQEPESFESGKVISINKGKKK